MFLLILLNILFFFFFFKIFKEWIHNFPADWEQETKQILIDMLTDNSTISPTSKDQILSFFSPRKQVCERVFGERHQSSTKFNCYLAHFLQSSFFPLSQSPPEIEDIFLSKEISELSNKFYLFHLHLFKSIQPREYLAWVVGDQVSFLFSFFSIFLFFFFLFHFR